MDLDLSRIDVMVVNPSRALQQILKQVLWDVGLRHLRALRSGAAAWRAMNDLPADLLFVDGELADGPGTAFVRRLRRSPASPAPFVSVIATIGDPTLQKIMAARDAGADEVVTRPVTVKGVMQKVAAAIDRPRPYVLAPGFIGPDRRHAKTANALATNRRNPLRRDSFEVSAMPLLQMKQRGERQEAEKFITEARHVLHSFRMTWIDGDLDKLSRLLAEVSASGEFEALRPVLQERLQSAARTMEEHGYDRAAEIAGQLLDLLGRSGTSGRTAQLLKVNVDSLRAVIHARPEAADQLAQQIVEGLQQLAGPPGR